MGELHLSLLSRVIHTNLNLNIWRAGRPIFSLKLALGLRQGIPWAP